MYADVGRPSIPPERLLKASLLIGLFSVRSERAFCEELRTSNLLFRKVLGHATDGAQLRRHGVHEEPAAAAGRQVGQQLFDEVVLAADRRSLLSDEQFTVDGTLVEAAASLRELQAARRRSSPRRRRPGQPLGGLSWGPARQRHAPERDGPGGETLSEGQGEGSPGWCSMATCADGEPQRPAGGLPGERSHGDARSGMRSRCCWPGRANCGFHPRTLGGDKGYDTRGCVGAMRARGVTLQRGAGTRAGAPALSMDARPGIAAMRSVSV